MGEDEVNENCPNILWLYLILDHLKRSDLLNQEIYTAIISASQNALDLSKFYSECDIGLTLLGNGRIATQENLMSMLRRVDTNFEGMANAMLDLHDAGLLNPGNLHTLERARCPLSKSEELLRGRHLQDLELHAPVVRIGMFAHRGPPQLNQTNRDKLAVVGFPDDLTPEEYTCELGKQILDDPVELPMTKQICDRATISKWLERNAQNPYNRAPMEIDDVTEKPELKEEINAWVNLIVEAVTDKKQKLQLENPPRNDLTNEEYVTIKEAASNAIAFRHLPHP